MPQFNKDNYQEPAKVINGDYPFTVVAADETVSKNNNQMINLELQVDAVEQSIKVFDRLVFTDKALGFIKRFCEAVGLDEKWESGSLEAEDCIGAEGVVHLERGDQYMEVAYYLKKGEKPKFTEQPKKQTPAAEKVSATVPPADDELPF